MKRETLKNRILNAGLKNTKYRVDVIELLSKTDGLLSAQEIHKRLIKKGRNINLSTVYRALDVLEENQIINRVTLENEKQALYEYSKDKHHHFMICNNCNKITPIYYCPMEEYENQIRKTTGFNVTGHNVIFYGICKECQKATV